MRSTRRRSTHDEGSIYVGVGTHGWAGNQHSGRRRRKLVTVAIVGPMAPLILETERLRLRPFRLEDRDELFAVLGDGETMRYYPEPYTKDGALDWIQDNLRRYRQEGFGLWAMELKATGELAGDCGPAVREVEGKAEIELGWHVKRAFWGQGLATEAAAACRDWIFRNVRPTRLIALVRPENVQSRRVAEKIGMTVEGEVAYGFMGWLHLVYAIRPEMRFLREQDEEAVRTRAFNGMSVMALLANSDGAVLLNLRDDAPSVLHPGHWAIIGGGVEEGEDLFEALRREVREEIGYGLEGAQEFCRIIDWEGRRHLVVVYVSTIDAPIGELSLGEGREIRFFPPEQLESLLVTPFVREVLRAYFDEDPLKHQR